MTSGPRQKRLGINEEGKKAKQRREQRKGEGGDNQGQISKWEGLNTDQCGTYIDALGVVLFREKFG